MIFNTIEKKAHCTIHFSGKVVGVILRNDIFVTNLFVAKRWLESLWQQ